MQFSELRNIVQHHRIQLAEERAVSHLLVDSRKAINYPGTVFFAIKGANHNGHDYVRELYNSGIRQFVVEDKMVTLPDDCNVVHVESTIATLQEIAAFHREQFDVPVVGITGSNGKTIVKEWLTSMLINDFLVAKSPKSFNSQLGVPLSVWQLQNEHQVGVFEAGISESGEMTKLQQIIRPTVGIFTNIGEAHSEGFSSQSEKVKEKLSLFQDCKAVIYCKDHLSIHEQISSLKVPELIAWTYRNDQRKENEIGVTYREDILTVHLPGKDTFSIVPKYRDPASIENLVHCLICALHLGVSFTSLKKSAGELEAVQMRLSIKQAQNGCYLIDDSYNSDLSALEIALDFLRQQSQRSKKTVILSDILQSGMEEEVLYEKINELLVSRQVGRLVGIGTQMRRFQSKFSLTGEFYPDVDTFLSAHPHFSREMILIKGARNFHLEKVVSFLELKTHQTVLEVNLEAIAHNLNFYRGKLQDSTKLMVMVKALAYGGSYEIANLLQYHGVDYLGVAYADEGVRLRQNGIKLPIMVMNTTNTDFEQLAAYDLYPEIYSLPLLRSYLLHFGGKSCPPVHLKFETGMNRLGFVKEDLPELNELLTQNKDQITVAGIFTHLASSENQKDRDFTIRQITLFDKYFEEISITLGYRPLRHVLNTSGISNYPAFHYDMVRLGIGLYGFDSVNPQDLQVVSTFKTHVSQVKHITAGESVGYGRSFTAEKDMNLAVLAVGYADGYRRSLSNGIGSVNIGGHLVPIVGKVCMDMTMVDVSGLNVQVGDEAILFGDSPSLVQLADWMDTIPYEVLTNVGDRVKRVFISE